EPGFETTVERDNPGHQACGERYGEPSHAPGWSRLGGYYGHWGGWGGGIFYTPSVVNVPVEVYRNTLTVSIVDRAAQGKEVYRSTAVHTSQDDNLNAVMPYLMQAIFDDFPGNNGQTRVVKYALPR